MVAYLTVTSGPEAGRHFALDQMRAMHIGRGSGCEIMLTDPVSSRFHAVVYFEDSCWQVRDSQSRNGTLVNGRKTDHAVLDDSTRIQVGATELQFFDDPEDSGGHSDLSQTVVADRTISLNDPEVVADPSGPLRALADTSGLLDLYVLSTQLLRLEDPEEVIETVLRLLRDRTGADVGGLLWLADGDRLTPERVFPAEAADRVRLSRQLSRRVARRREAIWIKHELEDGSEPGWSDAICVPLLHDIDVIGAVHLYREQRRFGEGDFDFAVTASRLLGHALWRSRKTVALAAENRRLAARHADFHQLIGESQPVERLKSKIERVGRANGCVLIRGESGVGKELVASAIHDASPRADRPRLSVNCAAIPRDLIESQLFGHKKGAFTGADTDHAGWFQQAHTGTLFLDEIGELPLEGQAKLLRILEGHPFLPVGATQEVSVDVRVVAATNRDLADFVRDGGFREDLYYRLSVFELYVPPLRERGDDVRLLINHFLDHFRRLHGRPNLQLAPGALKRLVDYHWPGNIRQLRNVIDSAVVMADGNEILSEDLGLRDAGLEIADSLRLSDWEERLIRTALDRTHGNVPEAAQLLGISRATAYRKLKDYGIPRH